jgi:hypothetical protein
VKASQIGKRFACSHPEAARTRNPFTCGCNFATPRAWQPAAYGL